MEYADSFQRAKSIEMLTADNKSEENKRQTNMRMEIFSLLIPFWMRKMLS